MRNNKLIGMLFVFVIIFSLTSIYVFSEDTTEKMDGVNIFYTHARCKDNGKIKHIASTFSRSCPDDSTCVGPNYFAYCDSSGYTAANCVGVKICNTQDRGCRTCPDELVCKGSDGYAFCSESSTTEGSMTELPEEQQPNYYYTASLCQDNYPNRIGHYWDLKYQNCPDSNEKCVGHIIGSNSYPSTSNKGYAYCEKSLYTASLCVDGRICNTAERGCYDCPSGTACTGSEGYAYCDPDAVSETPTVDCGSYKDDTLEDCSSPDCEIVEEVCIAKLVSDSDEIKTTGQGQFQSLENQCLFTREVTSTSTTDVTNFNSPTGTDNPLLGGFNPITAPTTPISTPLPGTGPVTEPVDPYPEGDPEPTEYDQCPDNFDDYIGLLFTLPEDTILDTRDRQFRNSLGDYPTDFEFGYDVELEILDSADREDICWFFIRALEVYDGDEPEFYVKFNSIEEFLDLTECESDDECEEGYYCSEDNICEETECEVDSDCGSGYYCEDKSCVETDKDILALVGFYPVLNDEISDAKELGALSVGYYDSENTNDLDIDDNRLDLLIKTDDSKYREDNEILFDDVDFNDMLYVNSAVKAYWIMNDPCGENVNVDDLVELYNMFIEENSEIPVAINFDTLDCALEYVEDTEEQFVDIILFNLENVNQDSQKATEILGASIPRIKIIPLVSVMLDNNLMEAEEIKDLGLSVLDEESFFGLLFEPYDKISEAKNKVNYKNVFKEVFCEAGEIYYGEECNFKAEKVNDVKIAFLSNSGVNENSRKTFELINKEKADLVIHLGNLGYDSTPDQFRDMLSSALSEDIEFLAVIGNEEFVDGNWDSYVSLLEPWSENLDCEGLYGNKMVCYIEGVSIILSGVGTDFMTQGHEAFITEKLSVASDWTICAWHKSNKDLRISGKDDNDNLGINYYNLCKNSQAIIASGYDMAYARTKLLTNLNPITSEQIIDLSKGSFAFMSGLGGYGYDRYDCTLHDSDPWWASLYSLNIYKNEVGSSMKSCDSDVVSNVAPGAMFITFNYNENPNIAKAEFITVEDEIIDSFYIYLNGYEEVDETINNDGDDDDEPIQVACIPAGTSFNPSIGPADPYSGLACCEGLDVMTPLAKYNTDCSQNDLVGYSVVCSDCGNNVCDNGENKCACPEDCN